MASAAAYALFGIDPANAVLIGVNGLHRASLAARGGLALTAGVGEVRPVVLGIQTVADVELIPFECQPLPLRERMHDLRFLADRRDVKGNGTFHTIQIVV